MRDMWKVVFISNDSPLPEEGQGPLAPTYSAHLLLLSAPTLYTTMPR